MLKFIYALNSIAVVGLIFAYISPFINPEITGFFAIFGLGYPFILVVNVLFLLFWLLFKRKYILLPLLGLLLGFFPLRRTIALKLDDKKEAGLSVMTFNIGKTRIDFHNKKKRQPKIDRFKKFLKKTSPDIICVQERFPYHYDHYKEIFKDYAVFPDYKLGTCIYTKLPIVNSGNIPFDTQYHNGTWADIKVDKDTFRFYSVHLSSNRVPNLTDNVKEIWEESKYILDKYNEHAQQRVSQLQKVLDHAQKSPHHIIINGDFNDVPQSSVYRMIDEKYKDAFLSSGLGLAQTFRSRFLGLRIDYAFTDPSIKVLDQKIIDTRISDHLPVVTTLGL